MVIRMRSVSRRLEKVLGFIPYRFLEQVAAILKIPIPDRNN